MQLSKTKLDEMLFIGLLCMLKEVYFINFILLNYKLLLNTVYAIKLATMLISKNVKVDEADNFGRTPLHYALARHIFLFTFLIRMATYFI